ncbi:MAG: hypoxanthine phosphoribosyltransferase [Clostridia bacterium]|nr:hypoxanthine phosphoribosyltransferase [Clostridia bacterium]
MHKDLKCILVGEEEIAGRVKELGEEITRDYKDKNLLCVGILNGSAVFMSDLIRKIKLPLRMEFMAASSYGSGSVSSGSVKITRDLNFDIAGYDVLIVEDIIDTGVTLSYIKEMLWERNPRSVKIAAIFDKPARRRTELKAEYTGFTVPDEFIVGYGLDYDRRYRNLPYIGVLKPEIYSKDTPGV